MTVEILVFIAVMSMVAVGAWLNNKSLRLKQDEQRLAIQGNGRLEALAGENQELKDQVSFLRDRIAVLERIATDPAERTSREIESLR